MLPARRAAVLTTVEGAPAPDDVPAAPRRRPWFALVLGVALLAAGAGAWMLGKPPAKARSQVLGHNLPVNPGATDRRDITANNSPSLARNPVDPANLVVANRIDRPVYSCALRASFNGGASWEDIKVPFPAGEEDPPRCFAPDVAYASDGTLYMSFVTLKGNGNVPNALWTISSKDGGRTLSVPVRASGPLTFQVQLTADPSLTDRLYLTWLQAEATGLLLFPNTGNPIVTSTSTDGGATWSAPVRVSSPSRARAVAPSPAFGPKGELYVLYLDLQEDRLDYGGAHEGRGGDPYDGPWALVLARSTDHGATWQEALVDAAIRPTERFIVFLPPTPTLAVDPGNGRIHVGFTDGRLGDPDVDVWTSSDGGKTFGPPVRVNDTPQHDGSAQYLPRLDVAPNGRLDVVYFDRRADQANVFNEVSLQSSFDGGRTFGPRVRVSDQPFDSRVGPGSERQLPDLGSSIALISTTRRALAVWTDTRAGTEITSKQDLASAVVDVPRPARSSRGWLRVVGGVGVVLGLASLLLAIRRAPSPRFAADADDPTPADPEPSPRRRRARRGTAPSPAPATPVPPPPVPVPVPVPALPPTPVQPFRAPLPRPGGAPPRSGFAPPVPQTVAPGAAAAPPGGSQPAPLRPPVAPRAPGRPMAPPPPAGRTAPQAPIAPQSVGDAPPPSAEGAPRPPAGGGPSPGGVPLPPPSPEQIPGASSRADVPPLPPSAPAAGGGPSPGGVPLPPPSTEGAPRPPTGGGPSPGGVPLPPPSPEQVPGASSRADVPPVPPPAPAAGGTTSFPAPTIGGAPVPEPPPVVAPVPGPPPSHPDPSGHRAVLPLATPPAVPEGPAGREPPTAPPPGQAENGAHETSGGRAAPSLESPAPPEEQAGEQPPPPESRSPGPDESRTDDNSGHAPADGSDRPASFGGTPPPPVDRVEEPVPDEPGQDGGHEGHKGPQAGRPPVAPTEELGETAAPEHPDNR